MNSINLQEMMWFLVPKIDDMNIIGTK